MLSSGAFRTRPLAKQTAGFQEARAGGVSDQNEGAMLSFADLSVDAPYGPDRTVLPRALQALLL